MSTGYAAVIPVYNHGRSVPPIVKRLRAACLPVFLVDDASSDGSLSILESLAAEDQAVTVVRRAVNGGKGAAVKDGARAAAAAGMSHLLQIDADGQHDPTDISRFLDQSLSRPGSVVCGVPIYDRSVPRGRLYGRYATHVWVWIETLSLTIRDSMCGFRIYPLTPLIELLDSVPTGDRMEFDIEVLVRLSWMGVPIINLPTRVTYPLDGTSGFRPLEDNLLISWTHTRLFFGMLRRLPQLLWRRLGGG
jgi:glycosyltransferase involved in cell wall biosynthesis